MHILFIGTDRQVFTEGTEARRRFESYSTLGDEVHFVVFTKRSMGFTDTQLAQNVYVHPTNSATKFGYIPDAVRIGKGLSAIDIVSAQDPFECSLAALPVVWHHRASFQIQMHIDAFGSYFKHESILNPIRSAIARFTLPRADCVRPVSERIKRSVSAQRLRLKHEPVVLPVYVDVLRFEQEAPSTSLKEEHPTYHPLVLMAGRLVPQKDIPTALRAFAAFHAQVPTAGLVLVGEGPDKASLETLVRTLGLLECVTFTPWQKDMLSYLKTADVFLMTSLHEGYQRALGEAAAAGVPVVTTDTGPVGSIYLDNDSVLVCSVGDHACIAEKLLLLSNDPTLRARLVARARDVAHTAIAPSYEEYLASYCAQLAQCHSG